MCLSGDCDNCRDQERVAALAYQADEDPRNSSPVASVLERKRRSKPTRWLKFSEDTAVGPGADQADPVDTRFLTISPK